MHACMALPRSFIYGILRKARQYIYGSTLRVGDPLRWSACIKAEVQYGAVPQNRYFTEQAFRSVPFRRIVGTL